MLHLAALKRTASLDDAQLIAWHNALGAFSVEVINTAVLRLAVTENRFPEFGDMFQTCRELAIRCGQMTLPYTPHGSGEHDADVSAAEIRDIAGRFNLKVL